jgi:hypothetical protein
LNCEFNDRNETTTAMDEKKSRGTSEAVTNTTPIRRSCFGMANHKEITTIENVIGILEAKINEFQTHIHSRKPDRRTLTMHIQLGSITVLCSHKP